MAVIGGVRRTGLALPGTVRVPRSSVRPEERPAGRSVGLRAARRPTRVGLVLAAIAVAFTGAFVSLSQSVRVAATSYDVVRLASQRDRLAAQRQEIRSDLLRLGSEPAIRKLALDAGLGQLDSPLILPAR